MSDAMTRAVRDDLAKLAYALCKGLPKNDAKGLLRAAFARPHGLTDDMAFALYVRGKDLARRENKKERPSDFCCLGAGCSNPSVCNGEIGKPCGYPGTRSEWASSRKDLARREKARAA